MIGRLEHARGFRQRILRGFSKVETEWEALVSRARNLTERLTPAPAGTTIPPKPPPPPPAATTADVPTSSVILRPDLPGQAPRRR